MKHYLLYLLRAKYHTTNPHANTNTTLAARLAPRTVPRGMESVSTTGPSETKHDDLELEDFQIYTKIIVVTDNL